MNSDPEDFKALRRLLVLKRYEQPPPGYFNDFSKQVVARIRAGEQGDPPSLWKRLLGGPFFWQRLSAAVEARPALAGVFGAAVCALLISGIVYSESAPAPVAQGFMPAAANSTLVVPVETANVSLEEPGLVSNSTNPLEPPTDSLFNQLPVLTVEPATLEYPAGN